MEFSNITDVPNVDTTEDGSSGGGGGGYGGKSHDKSIIPVIFVGCVGIVGNLFVIVVIGNYPKMLKRLTTIFILNQSATDLASSVFMVTTYAVLYASSYEVPMGNGLAGELFCRMWLSGFLVWGCLASSTYNLLCITLERFMMVVLPIYHKTTFTRRKAYVMILFVWLAGLSWNGFWNMTYSYTKNGRCLKLAGMPSEAVGKFYGLGSLATSFFIPLILMVYMYSHMIWILRPKIKGRNRVAPLGQQGGPPAITQGHQSGMSKAQMNLTKTMAIVVVCFFACWILNQFLWFTINLGYHFIPLHGPFARTTVVMAMSNSCVNPFIYIFKLEEFQQGVRQLFRKRQDPMSDLQTKTNSTATGSQLPST